MVPSKETPDIDFTLIHMLFIEIKGFAANAEELDRLEEANDEGVASQEMSSSDTTDADVAVDVDELLDPGDPVYFNYATAENIPSSLTVSFSLLPDVVV